MIFENRLKAVATALSAQTLALGVTITMGAAVTGCRSLQQCITDGAADTTAIKVGSTGVPFVLDDGTNWQDVECTVTSGTVLTITKLGAGSNGTNPVTLSNSTPTVFNSPPASWLRKIATSADAQGIVDLAAYSGTPSDTCVFIIQDPSNGQNSKLTVAAARALFGGAADTTAPVLSAGSASSTGTSTATGSVTTNEGNGTLYALASTSSTETAANIKTSGSTQAVSSTGVKTASFTGLTASTTYYVHFVQVDAAGNTSNVIDTASFVTGAAADTTAPTLSSPTGTATGSATASGSVTTNEANGTLYYLASANATETAATVKAGSSQPVTATGAQNVTFSGLTASTQYYAHYLHRDAAGNDSTVANSAVFTTQAAADTTAPTLSSPTGTQTGQTTATGSVSTNEANGTLYYMVSANATETAATVKAGSSQAVTATGTQNVSFTGLTANTQYYVHFLHRDAAGNDSTVANSAAFTTASGPTMASLYNLTATNSANMTGGNLTMTFTSPDYYAAPANTRVNIRSNDGNNTVPTDGTFKWVWVKKGQPVPTTFSSTSVPAGSVNGNQTTHTNSIAGNFSKLGSWANSSSPYYGTYDAGSFYIWGTPGTYNLWVMFSDGSMKVYDNNTGTAIDYVCS